ncbi:MAG: biotin/lipoyl-binding protein, partial [Bacillota bacterium]|nr:biotin/lipoyl-binding protein [Bacillota bacterium]
MKRVVLVILAMVIVLTGCSTQAQTDKNSSPSSSSNVQASNPVFIMAGVIDADEKAAITSKIALPTKVASINVAVGSTVKKGDTLLALDTTDIENQVAQAQAVVNTAEANLVNMQAGTRPEQIASDQASLDDAKTNYLNAKNNYDRSQQLLAAGA